MIYKKSFISIHSQLTMLFWSRKPEGWRCLLPVSSGPYTDLGSASTMGLVLKALGSGAPGHRIDFTLILSY